MTIRTHYDNLHIPPTANAQEIRQAYRRLSKQYHPDLNTDPDAHRIMQLINQAYEVLSDPQKRAEHDLWIEQQRVLQKQVVIHHNTPAHHTHHSEPIIVQAVSSSPKRSPWAAWFAGSVCAVLAIGLVAQIWWAANHDNTPTTDAASTPNLANTLPASSEPALKAQATESIVPIHAIGSAPIHYVRPINAPNGNPFPQNAGYIDGYALHTEKGEFRLIVENIRNSSDVFAQLFRAGSQEPLRTFFIPERSHLDLANLSAGNYIVRYQQLDGGEQLHSETIILQGKQKDATVYLQRGSAPIAY